MHDKIKILIVDDEPNILSTLADILQVLNYTVLTANDGVEAIETVKKEKIDVVLMDFKMAGMNGVEVSREIIKIDQSLKIIFITGYYDENVVKDALHEGIGAICPKPLNIPQLLDYIKAAAESD
jgi:CheY-like chemotaxis protein